jgi:hypothetical protein
MTPAGEWERIKAKVAKFSPRTEVLSMIVV